MNDNADARLNAQPTSEEIDESMKLGEMFVKQILAFPNNTDRMTMFALSYAAGRVADATLNRRNLSGDERREQLTNYLKGICYIIEGMAGSPPTKAQ